MLNEEINQALGELYDREQKVVRLRFGLDDGQMRTLEEVGRSSASPASGSARSSPRPSPSCATPRARSRLRDYLDDE